MTREEARNEIDYLINDGVVTEKIIVPLEQRSIDALKVAKEALHERPKGRWIKATPLSDPVCPHCRRTPKILFGFQPPFCPNCGADMKGEE